MADRLLRNRTAAMRTGAGAGESSRMAGKPDWLRRVAWSFAVLLGSGLLYGGFVYKPRPDVATLINGAALMIHMGLVEEARTDLEEALERSPGQLQAHLLLGAVEQHEGNFRGALDHFKAAEDFVGALGNAGRLSDYYVNRGLLRLACGDFPGAGKEADQIERLHVRPAAAFLIRSFSRLGSGDDKGFRQGLERAFRMDPSDPIFRFRREFILDAIPWASAFLIGN